MEYYSVPYVDYLKVQRDGLDSIEIPISRERDGGFCTENQSCGTMRRGNDGTGPDRTLGDSTGLMQSIVYR